MFSPLRNKGLYAKFDFATAVTMKAAVLWHVAICNLLQSTVPDEPDLKMEAGSSFESLVTIYKLYDASYRKEIIFRFHAISFKILLQKMLFYVLIFSTPDPYWNYRCSSFPQALQTNSEIFP
jgi:hypothetical protein